MLIDNNKVQDLVACHVYVNTKSINNSKDLYMIDFLNKFEEFERFDSIIEEYDRIKGLFHSNKNIEDNDRELKDILIWIEVEKIYTDITDSKLKLDFIKNYMNTNNIYIKV